MKPNDTSRQVQYLATVLALASGYYAIRAALYLPQFHAMFENLDEFHPTFSIDLLIMNHANWFLALVVATLITTLLAIWKNFRHHDLVVAFGIGLQFLLVDRAVASSLDPILRMIATMGSQ
jgi:hypothetical protein